MRSNPEEKLFVRNRKFSNLSALVGGFVIMFALLASSTVARGQDGAVTFKTNCTPCHGGDGSGNTPTGKSLKAADLRASEIQKKTNAELAAVIANGKGNMPPFKASLSHDQIKAVIAYVRTLKEK